MVKVLTERDRRILKFEKRMGFMYSGIILWIGMFLNLLYFLLIESGHNYLLVTLVNIGIIILACFVCMMVNRKLNRDLKANEKELVKKKFEKKLEEKSYEAGSGALYIPILGKLLSKLLGYKMKETIRYYVLTDNHRYEVGKELYDNLTEGMEFYIHFAKHSNIVLNVSKGE